ncbi:MAG: hypothetical protein IK147_05595, partial [Clostridia bacterium]|nr:hypothetical protein [Clostridia bacterium]
KAFEKAVAGIPKKPAVSLITPESVPLKTVKSVRDAVLSPCLKVAVKDAEGKVLSHYDLCCPPAIPIAVPGEEIDDLTVKRFLYFGINEIYVIKK